MPVYIEEPGALVVFGVLHPNYATLCVDNGPLLRSAGYDVECWVLSEDQDIALQRVLEVDAESDDVHHVLFRVTFHPSGFHYFLVHGILHGHDGFWRFYDDIPLEVAHSDGTYCIEVTWYPNVQC